MFIKVFLIFLFLYNNSVFAESYIENLEIINDIGKPIQYHVEVAKTDEEQAMGLMNRLDLKNNSGMLFLFDNENPKFGTSSFVSFNFILGLCCLHTSATSFTVKVSFVKLKISDLISFFSSINLKHLATSIKGTRLLICLPPANSLIVPFCDAIFENKFGIMSILVESVE